MNIHIDQSVIDKLDAVEAWAAERGATLTTLPPTHMYRMLDDSILCSGCADQYGEAQANSITIRREFNQVGPFDVDSDDASFDAECTVLSVEEFSATVGRCADCTDVFGELCDLDAEADALADTLNTQYAASKQ